MEGVRLGLTNVEIAIRSGIGVETVKFHVSNMLGKLNMRDRRELAAWQGQPTFVGAPPGRRLLGLGGLGLGWFGAKAVQTSAAVGATAAVAVGVIAVVAFVTNGDETDDLSEPTPKAAAVATPTPTPTPAAGKIAFVSGNGEVYVMNADGSASPS